jgi:CRP/FNR family transcriptional regulator, nitrogen oxide reductase regulator
MKEKTKPGINDLEKTSLFSGLNLSELEAALYAGTIRGIETGGFYFQEGDPADRLYILFRGKIKLTQVTPEGQQVILRYISPGEEFGVIAVLSEIDFPVSAEAVEDSASITWDSNTLRKLIQKTPMMALNAIQILAGRVREFQDRIRELATERVERRLARTLLRLVRQAGQKVPGGVLIDLPLSRQDLAEMTGTTLYTASRLLSQWETRGIIRSGRERITIIQPHNLVVIAEDLPPGMKSSRDEE